MTTVLVQCTLQFIIKKISPFEPTVNSNHKYFNIFCLRLSLSSFVFLSFRFFPFFPPTTRLPPFGFLFRQFRSIFNCQHFVGSCGLMWLLLLLLLALCLSLLPLPVLPIAPFSRQIWLFFKVKSGENLRIARRGNCVFLK